WGWAQLWFYRRTGEPRYLEDAIAAGRFLEESAEPAPEGRRWRNPLDGNVHYGLAFGASGIALFLANLYRESRIADFRELALQALAYEMSAAVDRDTAIKWTNYDQADRVCEPYMEHGSA